MLPLPLGLLRAVAAQVLHHVRHQGLQRLEKLVAAADVNGFLFELSLGGILGSLLAVPA